MTALTKILDKLSFFEMWSAPRSVLSPPKNNKTKPAVKNK